MATIGVGAGSYIRPLRRARTRRFRVDASQTIKVGYLLALSADSDEGNRVKKAAADPTTDRAIVGIAAEDKTTGASPTADDTVLVWLATNDCEFIGHVQASETLDNDDISVEFGLVEDTGNEIYRVDTSETSAKLVRILDLVHAHGDTEGQVVFHFIAPERLYHD